MSKASTMAGFVAGLVIGGAAAWYYAREMYIWTFMVSPSPTGVPGRSALQSVPRGASPSTVKSAWVLEV